MGSCLTSVFKATVGLLVKKGCYATAEKLRQGDIADQKLRDVIVWESFKPIYGKYEIERHRTKQIVLVLVRVRFLIKDAKIPCQSFGDMRK